MNLSPPDESLNASVTAAPTVKTGGLRSSRNKPSSKLTDHIISSNSSNNNNNNNNNKGSSKTEDHAAMSRAYRATGGVGQLDESLHLLEATRKVTAPILRKVGISHDSPTSPDEFQLSTSINNNDSSFNASILLHEQQRDGVTESLRGESSFHLLNNSDQNLVEHLQQHQQSYSGNQEQLLQSPSHLDDLESPPSSPDDMVEPGHPVEERIFEGAAGSEQLLPLPTQLQQMHASMQLPTPAPPSQQHQMHASMPELSPFRQSKTIKWMGKIKKIGAFTIEALNASSTAPSTAFDASANTSTELVGEPNASHQEHQSQLPPSSSSSSSHSHKFKLAAKARQGIIGSAMVLKNLTKKGPHKNMELLPDDATTSTGMRSADNSEQILKAPSGDEASGGLDDDEGDGKQPMINAAQWDKEVAKQKRREKKLQRHEKLSSSLNNSTAAANPPALPNKKQLDAEARARLKSFSQENAHRRRDSARRRRQAVGATLDQTTLQKQQRDTTKSPVRQRTKSPARKKSPVRQVSDSSTGGAATEAAADDEVLMTPSQHRRQWKQNKVVSEQVRQRVRNSLLQRRNSGSLLGGSDIDDDESVSSHEVFTAESVIQENLMSLAELYRPQLAPSADCDADNGEQHEMSISELVKCQPTKRKALPSALTDSTATAPTEIGSSSFLQVSFQNVENHDKCDDYVQLVIDDGALAVTSPSAKRAVSTPRASKKSANSIATKKTANHSKPMAAPPDDAVVKSTGHPKQSLRCSSKSNRPRRLHKKVGHRDDDRRRVSETMGREHAQQAMAQMEAEHLHQSEPVFHYRHEPPHGGDDTATDVGVRSDNKRSSKGKSNAPATPADKKKLADATKTPRAAVPTKQRRSSSLPPAKRDGAAAPMRRQHSKVRSSANAAESATVFRRQNTKVRETAPAETTPVRRPHSKVRVGGSGNSGHATTPATTTTSSGGIPSNSAANNKTQPHGSTATGNMDAFQASDSLLQPGFSGHGIAPPGASSKLQRSAARRAQPRRSIDDADAVLAARKKKSSGRRSSRHNRESITNEFYNDTTRSDGNVKNSLEMAFQKRANKGYKTRTDDQEGFDDSTATASRAATIRW